MLCLQDPVSERSAQKARGMRNLAGDRFVTGPCSQGDVCVLGEISIGRGWRHLHTPIHAPISGVRVWL